MSWVIHYPIQFLSIKNIGCDPYPGSGLELYTIYPLQSSKIQVMKMTLVVVLAMHGAPPLDFPKDELTEFFKLHVQMESAPKPVRENIRGRYEELETKVRTWPRTEHNDPYYAGAIEMAQKLSEVSGCEVIVGYNEFCAPTVEEALILAGERKPEKIVVITPMMTKGGEHAGSDIPNRIANAKKQVPDIPIIYGWPFEIEDIARFLYSQVRKFE
jgi:sirohydrochlorin cobaltochelatase